MSDPWVPAERAGVFVAMLIVAAWVPVPHPEAAAAPVADTAEVQQKYWVFFTDRSDPPATSATDRWMRPVETTYVDRLRDLGVRPHVRSRWFHAVSARLPPEMRDTVTALPFVRTLRPIPRSPNIAATKLARSTPYNTDAPRSPLSPRPWPLALGASSGPLSRINAVAPLERGLDGHGVRVGFLDAHFGGLRHEAFSQLRERGRIAGLRTFTADRQSGDHGAGVVSVAAGRTPGTLLGPAHGATVLAATTEFTQYERSIEEDNFVAGLEWLHRMGADVVNVSIGYTTFDDSTDSYTVADLDGDTGITTRAVDRAAQLGVTVVVSAGNSGCADPDSCWYYLNTPADADSAIAVGAILPDSSLAPFSARGPTADGRTKPDVVVQGRDVVAAWGENGYARVGGTSFASPQVTGVVAQMLQVNPELSPIEIRRLLRQTASQAQTPDPTRGWGVVNADAAIRRAEWHARKHPPSGLRAKSPYRAADHSVLTVPLSIPAGASTVRLSLSTPLGHTPYEVRRAVHPGPNWLRLDRTALPPGVYRYVARTDGGHVDTGTLTISD